MDKKKKLCRNIWDWAKQEWNFLFSNINKVAEMIVFIQSTNLLRYQAFLMSMIYFAEQVVNLILFWRNYFEAEVNWRIGFVIGVVLFSTLAIFLSSFSKNIKANIINSVLLGVCQMMYIEITINFLRINFEAEATLRNAFYYAMFSEVVFQKLCMITSNQLLVQQLVVTITSSLMLTVRIAAARDHITCYFISIKAVIVIAVQSILLISTKKFQCFTVHQLTLKKKDFSEVVKLLSAISTSTAYVVKRSQNPKVIKKQSSEEALDNHYSLSPNTFLRITRFDLRDVNPETPKLKKSRSEIIKNEMLSDSSVETYSNNNLGKSIDIKELIEILEEMTFCSSSRAVTIKINEAALGLKSTHSYAEAEVITEAAKQISEIELINKPFIDILAEYYSVLSDHSLETFPTKFSFKDLRGKSCVYIDEFKLYDIDVMFADYEGVPVFVIVVMNNSNRALLDNLEQQNKGLDMSLAELTHDMRAPLHAILGYSENLIYKLSEMSQEESKLSPYAKKINANCEHLSTLVNDILDSTRIANGKFTLINSEFDVVALVKECLDIASTVQDNPFLEFLFEGPNELTIFNDPFRLKRVILNLLANSIKFTEAGKIIIKLKVKNEYVLIRVIDSGRGIPKKTLKHLFTRFMNKNSQFVSATLQSRGEEGIGLGLSTTRDLVAKLGPAKRIEVKSVLNEGSCFSFLIYCNQNDAVEMVSEKKLGNSSPSIDMQRDIDDYSNVNSNSNKDISYAKYNDRVGDKLRFGSSVIEEVPQRREIKIKVTLENGSQRGIAKTPLSGSNLGQETKLSKRSLKFGRNLKATIAEEEEPRVSESEKRLIFMEDSPEMDCHTPESTARSPPESAAKPFIEGIACKDTKVSFKWDTSVGGETKTNHLNILIIEDDSFNRDILIMYLTRYFKEKEAKLSQANSLPKVRIDIQLCMESAVDFVACRAEEGVYYSLVLTDYHLPNGRNGVEFVCEMKKVYAAKQFFYPQFMLVSGTSLSEQTERVLFFRCILKPFRFDQFSIEMDKWVKAYLHNSPT
jgi:signal transduction histidine kinase/CheY-like chemotaxis protein